VSFVAITLCVASQRVFINVVYFVIDSVRKLLDTPSYIHILAVYGGDCNLPPKHWFGSPNGVDIRPQCSVLFREYRNLMLE
jgi:hypothetical protein